MEPRKNPIEGMDYSFRTYLEKRKAENARHMDGNAVPDYAYGMDYEIRKKLDSIPGLFSLGKKMLSAQVSCHLQQVNQYAACATPTTFPDVYEIGCECARRLGIAIPNIYIFPSTEINAYTIAADDTEPIVVVHSALYERYTHGELKAVIGHECGHIQNYHATYEILAEVLLNTGIGAGAQAGAQAAALLTIGAQLALQSWSRAAEVTADRAGLICADSLEDCLSMQAKFMYGGAFGEHQIDYESLKEQLRMQMNNATKYLELTSSHPGTVRRMMAVEEFARCRVYYDWRPDLKRPDSVMYSREECDKCCKKYIALDEKAGK